MESRILHLARFSWRRLVSLVIAGHVIFLTGPTHAQVEPCMSLWIKAIGGEDTQRDNYAPSMIVTDDGFVVIGYSDAFGSGDLDFLVVKLDQDGNPVWTRVIGGPWDDRAYVVQQTADGGYLLVGLSEQSHESDLVDILVVKLVADGSVEWSKTIDSGSRDLSFSARACQDGGIMIAGRTDLNQTTDGSDVLLVKLDPRGELAWARTFGGTGNEHAEGIECTRDGGFALVGLTSANTPGHQDVLVLKLDGEGYLQWARSVGGNGTECSNWDGIRQADDGSYFLGGKTASYGAGEEDLFLVKLTSDGTLDWCRTVGGTGADACWTHTPTDDGGSIAGGKLHDESNPDDPAAADILMVKFDAEGALTWANRLGDDTFQEIEEIKETGDGNYVIAGVTNSLRLRQGDFLVAELDGNGVISGCDWTTAVVPVVDSVVPRVTVLALTTTDVTGRIQVYDSASTSSVPELRVETICSYTTNAQDDRNAAALDRFALWQNYPNPFDGTTEITYCLPWSSSVRVVVLDASGRLVATLAEGFRAAGRHTVRWHGYDAGGLPLTSGIYFCQVRAGNEFCATRELLLVK